LRCKLRSDDQGRFIEDYACERRRLPPLLHGIEEQLRRQPKEKASDIRFGHGVNRHYGEPVFGGGLGRARDISGPGAEAPHCGRADQGL
jgi:hypothetical protein